MSNTRWDNLSFDAVIKNLFISDIIVTQKETYTHIVGSLSIFPKSKVSESSLFILQPSSGMLILLALSVNYIEFYCAEDSSYKPTLLSAISSNPFWHFPSR